MSLAAPLPAVVVMARWWAEGPVKTRLAAALGQEKARQVYRELVEIVWRGLEDPGLKRQCHFTPTSAAIAMEHWLPSASPPLPQADGDLGQRMIAALDHALTEPRPWVAVVGTDAPQLDAPFLHHAAQALDHADVVMTPTLDGGYAMLAMKQLHSELFRDIAWSTADVAAQTRARAKDAGLCLVETEQVRDLDEFADLQALQQQGYLSKD